VELQLQTPCLLSVHVDSVALRDVKVYI